MDKKELKIRREQAIETAELVISYIEYCFNNGIRFKTCLSKARKKFS